MALPFQLGLRNRSHMVSLIRSERHGRACNVLGQAYPAEMNPRLRILEQWGNDAASPRRAMQATVDLPLPRRHQAALTARLSPDLQHELHSGFEPQPVGRHERLPGVKGRVHLGPQHEPLTAGLPPLAAGNAFTARTGKGRR